MPNPQQPAVDHAAGGYQRYLSPVGGDGASEAVQARRQRLLDDAARHEPPAPTHPVVADWGPGRPRQDALTELLEHTDGLVLGDPSRQVGDRLSVKGPSWGPAVLIATLRTLYARGVRTLYLDRLVAELDQPLLDALHLEQRELSDAFYQRLRELDAKDVQPGNAYPAVSTAELLQTARREGIRVVALDCLATMHPDRPAAESMQRAWGFFASEVIGHYQRLPNSGKWIALVGGSHGSPLRGAPGLAEWRGTVSIRLEKGAEQLPGVVQADSGQVVNGRDHSELGAWWAMADFALTDRPARTISDETLDKTLAPDRFVIRRLADRQTLQLRYDSKTHKAIRQLPILRDGARFYIEQSDWPALDGRRFDDLAELAAQLEAAGMEQKLGKPPRLSAEQIKTDAEKRNLSLYLLSLQEARLLRGLDRSTGKKLVDKFDLYPAALKSDGKRKRLQEDAKRIAPPPERPTLPNLQPGNILGADLRALLQQAPGLVLGEVHGEKWLTGIQVNLLGELYNLGVRTLYIEGPAYELHQALLDEWFATQRLPDALQKEYLGSPPPGHYSQQHLFETAIRLGMRIVALDCVASSQQATPDVTFAQWFENRMHQFNQFATRAIAHHQALAPTDKWVAIVGAAHTNNMLGALGIAERTGAIGIRLDVALHRLPDRLLLDGGSFYEGAVQAQQALHSYIQADFLLTDQSSPLLPAAKQDAQLGSVNDFFIRPLADSRDFELRYRHADGDIRSLTIKRTTGRTVALQDSTWPELSDAHTFADLGALSHALQTLRGMRRVEIGSGNFLESQRYQQARDALLLHLTWFATEQERTEFLRGKNSTTALADNRQLLRENGVDFDSVPMLENIFASSIGRLSMFEKGAMLSAIRQMQTALLQRLAEDWQGQMKTIGAQASRTIAHNLYLAAADRRAGVCSAITTHIAATKLAEGPADRSAHEAARPIDRYLDKIDHAIRMPGDSAAKLLGLSMLSWKYAEDGSRFAEHAAIAPVAHSEILHQLETVAAPAVFELTLGKHAVAIGVNDRGGARHYFIADPNYGYAEFDHLSGWQDSLRHTQEKMLALALSQDVPAERTRFSLQQFRSDLAEMPLFPLDEKPGKGLRLSALGEDTSLSTLYNRDASLERDPRVRAMVDAFAFREYSDLLSAENQKTVFAKTLKRSGMANSWRGRYTDWFDSLLGRESARYKADGFYLAASLPQDGVLPAVADTHLQQMLDYGIAAEPVRRTPGAEQLLMLSQAQHQGEQLAGHFAASVRDMLADTANPGQWVPVLSTLKPAREGGYSLEFRHRAQPEEVLLRQSSDAALPAMHQFLAKKNSLIQHGTVPGEGLTVDGLNSAFAVQALLRWFGSRERAHTADDPGIGANLLLALQIHDYANQAQIGIGVLSDAGHVVQLIKLARSGALPVPGAGGLLGKAGLLLQLGSVGLDIYELTQAKDEVQRTVFGTQLAFDSAGVGMAALATLGVEAAGPLTIPLLGLGIGINTLAGIYAGFVKQAQQVGIFFYEMNRAYTTQTDSVGGGYRLENGRLLPQGSVVFDEIDLRSGQVSLGSPLIYPTIWRWDTAPYMHIGKWGNTGRDKAHAIDIRQRMGWPRQASLPVAHDAVFVLPFTSSYYIYCKYKQVPGICWRHDAGFDLLRRLHGDDFRFDVNLLIQYGITEMHPEYVDHQVLVRLGAESPRLQMPPAMESAHGLVCCLVAEDGGQHVVNLQPGIRLSLRAARPGDTRWVLDGRALADDTVRLSSHAGDWQRIGNVELRLHEDLPAGQITLLRKNGDVVTLELSHRNPGQQVSLIDAGVLPDALDSHLVELKNQHQLLGQVVEIRNYLPPGTGRRIEHAYFDIARERYLYIATMAGFDTAGEPNVQEPYLQTTLAALTDADAYFFNRACTKLLRVDPVRHKVTQHVALSQHKTVQPLRVWWDEGRLLLGTGQVQSDSAVYRLAGETLLLHRVYADEALWTALQDAAKRQDPTRLLERHLNAPLVSHRPGDNQPAAQLPVGGQVQIDTIDAAGRTTQRAWLRTDDGALIKPELGQDIPDDLQLVAFEPSATTGAEPPARGTALFYSEQLKKIWRQAPAGMALPLEIAGFSHLGQVGGQLLVTTQEGLLYRLAADGALSLYAVKRSWLHAHGDKALAALRTLAGQTALTLLDLRRNNGTAQPAWLSRGKLVLAGANLGEEALWLGLGADQDAGYFYDVATRQLYRQPLLDDTQLDAALGLARAPDADGRSPVMPGEIPAAQSSGTFSAMARFGTTLTVGLINPQLPPGLDGIDNVLISLPAEPSADWTLTIDQRQWAQTQRLVIDVDPLANREAAPASIRLELANPLALEVRLDRERLQLFDRASGRALIVHSAFEDGKARLNVAILLPDGKALTLQQLQQAWPAHANPENWPLDNWPLDLQRAEAWRAVI
jgi:hypothetical protein